MKKRYDNNPDSLFDLEITIMIFAMPIIIGIAIYLIRSQALHNFLNETENKLLNYQDRLKNKNRGYFENIILYPAITILNFFSFTLTKNIKHLYFKNAVKTTLFIYIFSIIFFTIISIFTTILFFILGCAAFILFIWIAFKIFLGSDSEPRYPENNDEPTIDPPENKPKPIPVKKGGNIFGTQVGSIKKDAWGNEIVYKKGTFFDEQIGKIEHGLSGDKFIDEDGNKSEIESSIFGKNKIIDTKGNEFGEYEINPEYLYCPQCGEKLNSYAKFCKECGNKINQ